MKHSVFLTLVLSVSTLMAAGDKGVTSTEIKLGASAVLSGPLGEQTSDYAMDARLFIHAKLLVEGLRRAGRNLNTQSFIKAIEEVGDISFGGFVANYSPQSHKGSTYVALAIIDSVGQLRY